MSLREKQIEQRQKTLKEAKIRRSKLQTELNETDEYITGLEAIIEGLKKNRKESVLDQDDSK